MTVENFNSWMDKWIRPSTLMAAIGAIVWGVQLNVATINQQSEIAENNSAIKQLIEHQAQIDINQAETAILLNQVAIQLKEDRQILLDHLKEAEEWKRRIILNERKGSGDY